MNVQSFIKAIISSSLVFSLMVIPIVYASPDTETLRPNATGSSTQLHPVPSEDDNWECVDETPSDDDTSYVSTDTTNTGAETDTYNIPNTAIGPEDTINSVTVYINVRSQSSTYRAGFQTVIRTHDSNYYGGINNPPSTYTIYSKTYNNNPNTASSWTVTEINAMDIGVNAYSGYREPFGPIYIGLCTQVWVVIDYTSAIEKEWHNIATWNFNLTTREWTSIGDWAFTLQVPSPEIYFPIGPILCRIGILVTLNGQAMDKINMTVSGGPSNFTFWKMTDLSGQATIWVKKGAYLFYIRHDSYLVQHNISIVKHSKIHFELNSTEYRMIRDWTTEIIQIVSGTSCVLAVLAIYAFHEQKTISKQWKKMKTLKGKPKNENRKRLKGKK